MAAASLHKCHPRTPVRAIGGTVLAIAFVLAQFVLAHHRADLVDHIPGEHCEWCVAGVSIPTADVSGAARFGVGTHVLAAGFLLCLVAVGAPRAYRSRAPPRSAFVVF